MLWAGVVLGWVALCWGAAGWDVTRKDLTPDGDNDDAGLFTFPTLALSEGTRLSHPFLDILTRRGPNIPSSSDDTSPNPSGVEIVTASSRALLVVSGHAFSITFDHQGQVQVDVVDELAGLDVRRVSGRDGRFGVVTAAGEGYVVDGGVERVCVRGRGEDGGVGGEGEDGGVGGKGDEGEGIEGQDGPGDERRASDDEVEDLAVGGGFLMAVVWGSLWVKGDSEWLGCDKREGALCRV